MLSRLARVGNLARMGNLPKLGISGGIQTKVSFKIQYFDRSILRHKWGAYNKNPLEKAGNLVRKIARGSIRRIGHRKGSPFLHKQDTYSKPGRPPYSRQPGSVPPFKMIYSVPNRLGTSVIVGMVGFSARSNPVPGLMEHGGLATRSVFQKMPGQQRRRGRQNRAFPQLVLVKKTIHYAPRPFMFPALMKARTRLPQLWKDSVK